MPEPLDTHATADQILGLHLSRWQDRAREAEARIVELEAELATLRARVAELETAARPLVWTSEPPKVAGRYVCRPQPKGRPWLYSVEAGDFDYLKDGTLWYGPIPEPKEADDADRS